eukprot:SAG22_NODE_2444_length_2565_cov_1.469586_1_plen_753_part_00
MAEQKQVTRIWRCPATGYDPTDMRLKRTGVTPHYNLVDGTEAHVKNAVFQFTDKKKLIDAGKMMVDDDNNVLSGPNYFQDIYGDDWSKVFLDLDDGDFATLEEAQEQTEKMKTWCLTTLPEILEIKSRDDIAKWIAISDSTGAKEGGFAASLHVCVGRWKIKWADHYKLLFVNGNEKMGLQERWKVGLPPMNKAPPKDKPYRKNVIDGTIYCKGRLMRMLYSAKAEYPARILSPVTCTRAAYRHIPTIGLDLDGCEVLEHLAPPVEAKEPEPEQSKEKEAKEEKEKKKEEEKEKKKEEKKKKKEEKEKKKKCRDPDSIREYDGWVNADVLEPLRKYQTEAYNYDEARNKFSSEDVCLYLSKLSPELGYGDWWKVGSFLRNKGRGLFADSFEVFHAWSNLASPEYKKKKAAAGKLQLKGDDIDPAWLRTTYWNCWNQDSFSFGTLRYIVCWSSEEGKKFDAEWGTHSVVVSIFENGFGRLGESDLARYMMQYTGAHYIGEPGRRAEDQMFQLGNGNIWRPRTELSMAKGIEDVLRFEILGQCYSYNRKIHEVTADMDETTATAIGDKQDMWNSVLSELYGYNPKAGNSLSKLSFRKTIFQNLRTENIRNEIKWNPWTPLLTKFPMRNSLFDLETFTLTIADPDDMIRYTTGYDWPTDPDGHFMMPEKEDIQFVLDFFAEITGDDNQFKYLLVLMAAALEGCNRFNEFVLMCVPECQRASAHIRRGREPGGLPRALGSIQPVCTRSINGYFKIQ